MTQLLEIVYRDEKKHIKPLNKDRGGGGGCNLYKFAKLLHVNYVDVIK